jgi:general secretion pathway protein D
MKSVYASARISAVAVLLAVSACNQGQTHREGIQHFNEGRTEHGLAMLEQASKESPTNAEYRSAYFRQREAAVNQFLMQAEAARNSGDLAQAEADYRRVLGIDIANARAAHGLEVVASLRRHRLLVDQAEALIAKKELTGAEDRIRVVLSENPTHREARAIQQRIDEVRLGNRLAAKTLKSDLKRPITLDFRDASIRNVFEAIARASGVSYVFDRDVRPDLRVTIQLRNKSIEDAVRVLLATNQLEQKILDDDIVIIYPNVPAKQREYQELTVKAFYLANADVKQVLNSIRTVVKTRDIYFDERLNALIMRDTAEAVRAAEKLVALQDRAEPEVVLQLEVMEVSTARLQELGIRFPEQVAAGVVGGAGVPGTITLPEFQNRNSSLVRLSISNPALILNLRRLDSDANLLANPHVRVRNREKARIHIGERVPVITTTSTANVGVSESVNYLDVGLKLELEPNIYLDDEVAMRVGLEVSNILETIARPSGTQVYRLGTRNAATTLRLRDGETQILAGLIQNDERNAVNKIPGLSDLPLIGRLFSNRLDNRTKTEIVLLITPRVVRNIIRPGAEAAEFASGTEASMGSGAARPGVPFSPPPPVLTPAPPTPAPKPPVTAPTPPAGIQGIPGTPGGPPLSFPPTPTPQSTSPSGVQQPFMPGTTP